PGRRAKLCTPTLPLRPRTAGQPWETCGWATEYSMRPVHRAPLPVAPRSRIGLSFAFVFPTDRRSWQIVSPCGQRWTHRRVQLFLAMVKGFLTIGLPGRPQAVLRPSPYPMAYPFVVILTVAARYSLGGFAQAITSNRRRVSPFAPFAIPDRT